MLTAETGGQPHRGVPRSTRRLTRGLLVLALAGGLGLAGVLATPAQSYERNECGNARWNDDSDGKLKAQVYATRMKCSKAKRIMVRYYTSGLNSPPRYNCTTFDQVMDGLQYACAHRNGMNRGAYMGAIHTRG